MILVKAQYEINLYSHSILLGPISRTDLSLASYHFVLDLSPQTDLSLFVKLAPDELYKA